MKESIREKISKGLKKAIKEGRFFTKGHREKISVAKRGINNPWFGKHLSEEAREKMSKVRKGRIPWNKGKKCPQLVTNWKGGVSKENELFRHSVEFRLWREAVFARDGWICQKTGAKGGRLHPHHIKNFSDNPELRFAIDNGITLSELAHQEFHKIYGKRNNTKEQMEEFLNYPLPWVWREENH